jgi:pimeloyl-ACP methyl ester carboxylesterase
MQATTCMELFMLRIIQFVIMAALLTLAVLRAHAETWPESLAIDPARGIDERTFLDINGVEQYVIIRGEDRNNPVLLYLHGGPGAAASLYAWKYFTRGGWEKSFTVVNWDQPGAAKTFARAGNKLDPALTIDRIADDGLAVAEQIASKLGKDKIFLVGGSWGSAIGVKMALKRPDLFYAYVGTAQMVDKPADEALGYRRVLDKARRLSHEAAIAELERAGPPPYGSLAQFLVQRKWANAYERLPAIDIQKELASTPGTVPADLQTWRTGFLTSDQHFRGADMKGPLAMLDVRHWGRRFGLPVFFIQGTEDDIAPMDNVAAYFEWLEAPSKKLLPIAGAGHNASTAHSEAFIGLLNEHVRPLAK